MWRRAFASEQVCFAGVLKYASAALTGLLKEPSTNAAVTQALRSFGVAEMAQAALSHHAQVRLLFLLLCQS